MNGVGLGKIALSMLAGALGGSLVTERLCERRHHREQEERKRVEVEAYLNSFNPPLDCTTNKPSIIRNPYNR